MATGSTADQIVWPRIAVERSRPMSALHDLLELPESVVKSAFVVQLTEGVRHPEAMLKDYAAHPRPPARLRPVARAGEVHARRRRSVAAYVHGSFGSGKSHFMSVLSLMLSPDATTQSFAWKEPELHALRVKHGWLAGEEDPAAAPAHDRGVVARGEALPRVPRAHPELFPDAVLPALFADEGLFANARELRAATGRRGLLREDPQRRPQGRPPLGQPRARAVWTAERFDRAVETTAPDERQKLFDALVRSHFTAYLGTTHGYVDIDRGLGELSRHARSLGFDAVVFFFDEAVLWLANGASDRAWVTREMSKLAKMVEAQDADRPAPLVSFLARQRDIVELVGDQLAGGDLLALREAQRFWEGRFGTIPLPDRNLPAIVRKRVVRPKDEAAAKRLDEAFDAMRRKLGTTAWQTLLGDIGEGEEAFRAVYPFSPGADPGAGGDERGAAARAHGAQGADGDPRRAPRGLRPRAPRGGGRSLRRAGGRRGAHGRRAARAVPDDAHGVSVGVPPADPAHQQDERGGEVPAPARRPPPQIGCSNCAEVRCRADNRLVKTLLLATLLPNVSVLKDLTVSRVVALNHGTLRSTIPGTEASAAVSRLREFAVADRLVRVGDQKDPLVHIELAKVDLRPVLESAREHDKPGARKVKLRALLFAAFGHTGWETTEFARRSSGAGRPARAGALRQRARARREPLSRGHGARLPHRDRLPLRRAGAHAAGGRVARRDAARPPRRAHGGLAAGLLQRHGADRPRDARGARRRARGRRVEDVPLAPARGRPAARAAEPGVAALAEAEPRAARDRERLRDHQRRGRDARPELHGDGALPRAPARATDPQSHGDTALRRAGGAGERAAGGVLPAAPEVPQRRSVARRWATR
jgi:hypothetical protein